MYVGAVSLLAGTALVLRSPSILGLALAAGLLAHVVVVLVEEPSLARKFGEAYEAYRRATPRWVPRAPRGPR
jgi:protein-S-isoprenylcysteine O-methyltransferase Ste14